MAIPAADPRDLDLAIDLATKGGERSLQWFRSSGLEVFTKGDGTPVTEADRGVERLLRERLARADPAATVVGEEEGVTETGSDRRWYFDPIDGTQGFVRGVPLYSTLVGLWDAHGCAVGVIYLPALGEIVAAGRGLGCTWNGRPCRVSERDSLRGAYVTTSAYEDWSSPAFDRVRSAGTVLKGWGDGYGYALVATGRIEAMVDPVVSPWDIAPLPVILTEAGGCFTDFGGEVHEGVGNGLGTNGRLHDELLEALATS